MIFKHITGSHKHSLTDLKLKIEKKNDKCKVEWRSAGVCNYLKNKANKRINKK